MRTAIDVLLSVMLFASIGPPLSFPRVVLVSICVVLIRLNVRR